ncbi:hypothetical protein [Sporomusa sp.]|nr:hypothetical protein [Sporomusa sp.]HWR06209.1 hypothetical protein [Sporomusa sp.]
MKDRAKAVCEELKSIVNEARELRAASFEENAAQPAEMSGEET